MFRNVSLPCKERQKAKFDKPLLDCSRDDYFRDVEKRWIANQSDE